MPRTGKGSKAQPPRAESDQSYGVKGDQLEAQRQLPLPDQAATRAAMVAAAPGPPAAAAPPGGPAEDPMGTAIARAAEYAPPVVPMGAPSQRPTEPISAGAPYGPGPGPEAMGMAPARQPGATARTLQILAETSSDSRIAEMADQALRRGQ